VRRRGPAAWSSGSVAHGLWALDHVLPITWVSALAEHRAPTVIARRLVGCKEELPALTNVPSQVDGL
jgi:hypothetical protein